MSSSKGSDAAPSDASCKGKGTSDDTNLNSSQDDGWEEYGKKSKNKNRSNASRQAGPQNSSPKAWGNNTETMQKVGMRSHGGSARGYGQPSPTLPPDTRKYTGGRGFTKPQSSNQAAVIPPPLKNGWGWSNRAGSTQPSKNDTNDTAVVHPTNNQSPVFDEVDDGDEDSDEIDDSDDELLSDGFDSDESQKSHETRKKNKWFKELFQCLDGLTVDQINEPERQWHCVACKGGPGAIDWYRGLLPVISHAKTKRSKRVKLHRELAQLLEEELKRRGTSAVPAGEVFGKWNGLKECADKLIVWPPMVVVMNTQLEKDENDKWIGMGNPELLEYFSAFSAEKSRHSYGPQGHRGLSVLIFEASAVGYAEAERLHKQFEADRRDRLAWERNRVPFYSGGKRQLYGFMAEKQDVDSFNYHCQGKSKLKYEMCSYIEKVVNQMKQMKEENQQLLWFKNKAAKAQKNTKAHEETIDFLSEKLRQSTNENRVVKLKTKKHHEQNKEEMDSQEQFYREQLQQFYDLRNKKEEHFELVQQYERQKATESESNVTSGEVDPLHRAEVFIKDQNQKLANFDNKREELLKAHKEKMAELKRRHWEEEMAMEKEFDQEFNKLIEDYTPKEQ